MNITARFVCAMAVSMASALFIGTETADADTPCSAGAADVGAAKSPVARSETEASHWLDRAYQYKSNHDADAAKKAFETSLRYGSDVQLVSLELGYLAADGGDSGRARLCFESALRGSRQDLADLAEKELAALVTPKGADSDQKALDDAYRKKREGSLAEAAVAFVEARDSGADPQLVALELGYIAAAEADVAGARAQFRDAEAGPDPDLRDRATNELAALGGVVAPADVDVVKRNDQPDKGAPDHRLRTDLYGESFGWNRVDGKAVPPNLVTTIRVRALFQLGLDADASVYAFGQATRDVASSSTPPEGVPKIYADDRAIAGVGALLRFWDRHGALFLQVGPAASLLGGEGQPTQWDVRGGFIFSWETSACAPGPVDRPALMAVPCVDVYSETIYVSRFDHNVIGFGRGRAGISYAAAGPVLSQVLVEGRSGLDRNGDYYNNYVDAGIGNRLRFLAPFRLDVTAGLYAGSYLGTTNRDPAPSRLTYVELRALAATYLEF